ncbi:MAG TPA: ATP-binding protein [Chloroflexota bacterium]
MIDGGDTIPAGSAPRFEERSTSARHLSSSPHLLILHGVLHSLPARLAMELLTQDAEPEAAAQTYVQLFRALAAEAALQEHAAPGDAWQQHLIVRLLGDDNVFAAAVRRVGLGRIGAGLRSAVEQDLQALGDLYHRGDATLRRLATDAIEVPWLDALEPLELPPVLDSALRQLFHERNDWGALLGELASHYRAAGTGLFAGYQAFLWLGAEQTPPLRGVRHPDPIRLDDLIGDQRQRDLIVRNTEQFLAGLPANNVLLYGDRGTGKSSTVKALLNAYCERGLCLLEVGRSKLTDFPAIVELLSVQPEHFILFVDDLSFDEQETGYKDLKAVLEGGLEVRPANVLVYATSNRRHLVMERQSDRTQPGDDELHGFDTVQEKLSLADRFGITLTFVTPDQEHYLEIVRGVAERRGVAIPEEDLRQRALQWATRHNGRSGRSARQFVDDLTGELARSSR